MWTVVGIILIVGMYILSIYNGLEARRAQIKMVKKSVLKNINLLCGHANVNCDTDDLGKSVKAIKNLMTENIDNDELNQIKEKIKSDIKFYNELVNGLNTQIQTFPINMFAGLFNVGPEKIITDGDF